MKLVLSVDAKADIVAIHSFGSQRWGRARSAIYIDALRDSIKALVRGDISGVAAGHVRPEIRQLAVGSHVIWYRIDGDKLRVLRVLHQRMDAAVWVGS